MPAATLVSSPKAARVPISLPWFGISPAAEEGCYFVVCKDAIKVLCKNADMQSTNKSLDQFISSFVKHCALGFFTVESSVL